MDSWICFSCVDCLCVPKGNEDVYVQHLQENCYYSGEFLWTVRLILEPAAFKKDSKAVTLIREKWLCSSLWIIIIIPGFIYSVGL